MRQIVRGSKTTEDIICWKLIWKKGDFLFDRRGLFPVLNIKYHVSRDLMEKDYFSLTPEVIVGSLSFNGYSLEMLHAYKDRYRVINLSFNIEGALVAKCIIPKGTIIFSNENEILTKRIVIFNPYMSSSWQINRTK